MQAPLVLLRLVLQVLALLLVLLRERVLRRPSIKHSWSGRAVNTQRW